MIDQINDTNLVLQASTKSGSKLGPIIPIRYVDHGVRYWTPKFIRETRNSDDRYKELKSWPEPELMAQGYASDISLDQLLLEVDGRTLQGLETRLKMTTSAPVVHIDWATAVAAPVPTDGAPTTPADPPKQASTTSAVDPAPPADAAAAREIQCSACRRTVEVRGQVFSLDDLKRILLGAGAYLCADCVARVWAGDAQGLREALLFNEVSSQEFKLQLVHSDPSVTSKPTPRSLLKDAGTNSADDSN